ncbi:hypothetical protein LFYK43_10030 [Ligilactobacillus salitolerans]|uniref:XcbB/CpsF family capsular polysaccharide biosynthesis protein n=1 Tax=Ligilactobacillus salitolerans TaxID=1808352 RepID=A0A401ISP8_9LACO|nr:XcbB/CpsF family capsular polysaccharide biosynthesis protein [Ligilactobacillus salitolerans]GBG94544.1 hypothetical protein LFYK43_10030 [Ligilactobacillus salitolerans]
MDVQNVDFLKDFNPDFTANKIRVNMHSDSNMLQLSVDNEFVKKEFKKLLAHDYILGEHINGVSYFQKRKTFALPNPELKTFEDLKYTIQDSVEQRSYRSKKLVVLFAHFSASNEATISKRMYFNIWQNIQKELVKDTMVLRIMDFNLSHGSGYINTVNFPDYEDQVQNLISFIMADQKIDKKNVVFWGSSKGGTGAFYHALLGDYKAVVVDPILDESWYIENKNDNHFMDGLRTTDLIPKINKIINDSNFENKKFVVTNSHFSFNYNSLQRVTKSDFISKVDIDMPNAYNHLQVVGYNSKVQSVTLLNISLDEQLQNALY